MCGLFLAIHRGGAVERARVERAVGALAHRGPDACGLHIETCSASGDTPLQLAFAHRRLSILDLDSRSNEPFISSDGVTLFNGEIYDYRDARSRLLADGPTFRTTGDVEVLHRLLARYGDAALCQLNGMWAYCFYSRSRRRVMAGRDRYGKKPLFYYADEALICFASEMKAITTYLGRQPRARRQDVATFLAHGMVLPHHDGRTFLEGISEVRPGCTLELDLDAWTLIERPTFDVAAATSKGEPANLGDLVQDAVTSRLVSDRQVGLLLSGGVDSTLILSVLAATGDLERVRCFTGDTGASEDCDYARRAAASVGASISVVSCDYDDPHLERFLRLCRNHEKPFPLNGNAMAMSEMYAQISSHGVPVVLDGTGADEVFGGYWNRQYRFAVRDAVRAGDAAWLAASLGAVMDDPEVRPLAEAALRFASGPAPRLAPGGGVLPFAAEEVIKADSNDPLDRHEGDFNSALILDAFGGRLGEWIWHNDRNAMAFGVENRSPFLDWRLIPFLTSGKEAKFVGPWNKHELRALYDRFRRLPTQWRRQKQGFRWTRRRFLRANQQAALALIESSRILPELFDVAAFLDAAAADDGVLSSPVTGRLIAVAGVEQAMGCAGLA